MFNLFNYGSFGVTLRYIAWSACRHWELFISLNTFQSQWIVISDAIKAINGALTVNPRGQVLIIYHTGKLLLVRYKIHVCMLSYINVIVLFNEFLSC